MPVLARLNRIAAEDARQFAYRILKFSILELLLRPGEKLNEAEIAGTLEMSRTPVRDVLGRLGRENLVEQIPQRGAFVTQINIGRARQAAADQANTGIAVLETLYAEHVPVTSFAPLRENLARQQFCIATGDTTGAVRTVLEFYRVLYELARLDMVWASLQNAGADFRRLTQMVAAQDGSCESTLLECRAMVEALEKRDNAAACRALQHQFARIYSQLPALHSVQPELFTEE